MFCTKCGQEISENSKFCPKCGTPVGAANARPEAPVVETKETPVVEATSTVVEEPVEKVAEATEAAPNTVEETVSAVNEAVQEPIKSTVVTDQQSADYNYGYNPADIPEPATQSGSKKVVAIVVALIAVVAAGALAAGYFVFGLFATPAQLISKSIDNGKNNIFNEYKTSYKSIKNNCKDLNGDMTFSVEATLGDEAKDLLDEVGSTFGGDLSWVESGRADIAVDVQEEQIGFDVKASLNGQDIGSFNAIVDADSEKAYLSIPEVFGDVALEAEGDFDSEAFMEMLASYSEQFTNYAEIYPDPDKFNKCVTKYTDIISKDLSKCEIDKGKTEITAGDVSAKYTELEIQLDNKTALKIADDLLKEFEDDDDLKELLRPIFEAERESAAYEGYWDDFYDYYDDFDDYWDKILDDASIAKDEVEKKLEDIEDDEDLNEDIATVYLYVDGFNFKGIAVEPEDSDARLEIFSVEKGNKSGLRFSYDDGYSEYVFEGQGETKKGLFNGNFTLEADDEEYLTVEVKDFDKKAYDKKRACKGDIILSLGEGLTGDLYNETSQMFGLAKYDIFFDTEDVSGTVGVDILVDDESFAKITMSYSLENVEDMKIPRDTVDFDNMSEDELLDFVKGINLDKLIKNLEKAGVPSDYYEVLEEINDALASGDVMEIYYALGSLMGSSSYDYYDYDYYDYDYDDYDYDDYDYDYDYDDYDYDYDYDDYYYDYDDYDDDYDDYDYYFDYDD